MTWKAIIVVGLWMVFLAAPADAAPITGQLNFVGAATVSGTSIDWESIPVLAEAGEGNFRTTVPGTGYFATIDDPNLTNTGDILDLTAPGAFPLPNFLHEFVTPDPRYTDLSFTLQGLEIPVLPVCDGTEAVGESCVAFVGSPFQLTVLPGGDTGVLFNVFGFFVDPTEGADSLFNFATGSFTAAVDDQTPNQVRQTIVGGGSVTASYGAQFNAVPVPEPATLLLFGTGLATAAARAKARRRREN